MSARLCSSLGRVEHSTSKSCAQESGNTVNFAARVTSRALEAGRATSILRSVRLTALGLTSMALTPLFVLPAAADPPLTVAEARARIAQLETDAAAIDQQYAGVKEQIK